MGGRTGIDVKDQVTRKVKELLHLQDDPSSDENLEEHGLNSMKTIELIVAFEMIFDMTFDDADLIIDNYNSIQRILNKLSSYGIE